MMKSADLYRMNAVPSVSALYADTLGEFLRARGLHGNVRGAMRSPAETVRIEGDRYAGMLIDGARALGDEGLGLRFGLHAGGAGFGMLGIAVATAPTLREAIRQHNELESITSTLGRATTRFCGKRVEISWHPARMPTPIVVEGILAGWVSFGRHILAERADILQVSFMHRRRAPLHEYETVFECPLRFESARYGVTIAAELLDARPRFADAALNESLNAWLGQCAASASAEGKPFTRGTTALLAGRLPLAEANEDAAAALLGVGRRTLQRALRAEGSSFRELLNAARAQRAIVGLLRQDVSMLELSAETGFDEQSSLCRAFRRWTGYAPLALKRRLSDVFQPAPAPETRALPARPSFPSSPARCL
ncbi:MAG TPA: AraC family transcriptional regulator ligand-binding domain-containing protein [Paucimonas sp.]|nr:AraC family transcriptional regulator ligand-binding domain-containing protein [Paucimonas sp.]